VAVHAIIEQVDEPAIGPAQTDCLVQDRGHNRVEVEGSAAEGLEQVADRVLAPIVRQGRISHWAE
jgi:hypothetical protein